MTTVFYNAACSKCRRVREILEERGEPYEIVEYQKAPPDRATLEGILDRLDGAPDDLVRRDRRFSELGFSEADCKARDRVVELLVDHPELLERPIVVRGTRAIVARPPERVLALFKE